MIAEIPAIVVDIGAMAGTIVASSAVVVLIVRSRLVRWLWRRNVTEPGTQWVRHQVRVVVVDELERARTTTRQETRR